MMQNRDKARDALSTFFQTGYTELRDQRNAEEHRRVDGLFVSDCGIIFSRYNGENVAHGQNMEDALSSLLTVIENISRTLLKADLMLTASIAYGRFDFDERLEFQGIVKNMMYAYLNAYLDNEVGKPKLSPGICRILTENLNDPFIDSITGSQNSPFNKVKRKRADNKHLYYYWMVRQPNEIVSFETKYKDTYNLKYRGMLESLKDFS